MTKLGALLAPMKHVDVKPYKNLNIKLRLFDDGRVSLIRDDNFAGHLDPHLCAYIHAAYNAGLRKGQQ